LKCHRAEHARMRRAQGFHPRRNGHEHSYWT
jgi:hypothetical protein